MRAVCRLPGLAAAGACGLAVLAAIPARLAAGADAWYGAGLQQQAHRISGYVDSRVDAAKLARGRKARRVSTGRARRSMRKGTTRLGAGDCGDTSAHDNQAIMQRGVTMNAEKWEAYVQAHAQLKALVEQQGISRIVCLLAEVCYGRADDGDGWYRWATDLDTVLEGRPVKLPAPTATATVRPLAA